MKRKLLVVLSLFFLYHYFVVATEPLPVLVEGGEPFEDRDDFYIHSAPETKVIAISSDAKSIVSGSKNGIITIWDTDREKVIRSFKGHKNSIGFLDISPNGKLIVSTSAKSIHLWDIETGKELKSLEGHKDFITAMAISPNGKTIVSGSSDKSIKIWDLKTGKEIQSLEGHTDTILSVSISLNSKVLVSSSLDGIKIWDIETGKELNSFEGDKYIALSVGINLKTQIIVSASLGSFPDTIHVWNLETGEMIKGLRRHISLASSIAITPNGQEIISLDSTDGIKIWNLKIGKVIKSLKGDKWKIHSIDISSDGKTIISCSSDDIIKIWDIETGKELKSLSWHEGPINSVAISSDWKTMVSSSRNDSIKIWDIEKEKMLKSLRGHKNNISSIAISPNGKTIVSASYDKSIKVWDIETGKELKSLEGHTDVITSIIISQDGKSIVSSSLDKSIKIWDIETGKELKKGHFSYPVTSLAISPNDKIIVSGVGEGSIKIWDIKTGRIIKTLKGHKNFVRSLAISQDGRTLVSGSGDKSIKIWDMETGKELKSLEGHTSLVTSVAISPNGKTIISSSFDGSVKQWNIDKEEWKKEFISGRRDRWAIFVKDPKGNYFNRGDDGTFLMKKEGTIVKPVVPKDLAKKDNLEIESTELSLRNDESLSFDLTLLNKEHNSYWIKANGNDGHCAIGENVLTKLEKGKKGKLNLDLTCTLPRVNPKPIAKHEFNLTLVTANESEFNVTVPVSISFVDINVTKAEVSEDGKNLNIEVKNIGDEKLVNAKVKLSKPFNADVVALTNFEKNTSKVLAFAIPKDVNLTDDDLVSLNLYIPNEENKNALPLYEWQHKSVPIILNKLPWYIYALWVLIAIVFLAMIFYYKRYKNPMVIKLFKNPKELLTLSPSQLKEAKKRLETINQWESTIQLAGVNVETVHNTLAFYKNPTVKSFSEHFNIKHYEEVGEFYKVHLPNLGLNVDNFLLYLGKEDAEKIKEKCPREDKIFVISSEEHQDEIAKLAHNKTNNIIAPTTVELSKLLLSKDIKRNLAQILAKCLSFKYLSSYQTKGGLMEESNFFGRTEIIKEMLTKERVNYLLVGARQLGKTSILKALEREYENSSTVECYYFSLEYSNILFELNQALRLSKENSLEEVVEAIRAKKKKVVFLIDEADKFIDKEESDKISSVFRKLAQENHAVFVLAGFWKLYYSAIMDYQSPLKNFGEVIHLGELESEACHELMIKPMQRIGVGYENEKVVKQLIENCGNRANLIAMVCADLLKELDGNVIEQKDIDRGLESKNVSLALNEWEALTKDEEANRINRLIVYLTFKDEKFSITEVLERIEQSELEISVEKIETSLKQLVLGFVFKEHRGVYEYRVPLVKKRLLEDEYRLEVTLKRIVRGLKGDKNRKA